MDGMYNNNWNNNRRSLLYWVAVFLLVFLALNDSVWNNGINITWLQSIVYGLYGLYDMSIGDLLSGSYLARYAIARLLSLLTIQILSVVLVYFINYIVGFLPDYNMGKHDQSTFYTRTVCRVDILIGIIIEITALRGFLYRCKDLDDAYISMIIDLIFLFVGSILYWRNTIFPKNAYLLNRKITGENIYDNNIWYVITNTNDRISSTCSVPWKGIISEGRLDRYDILNCPKLKKEWLRKCLIVIDKENEIDDEVIEEIKKIYRLPHVELLVLVFGRDVHNDRLACLDLKKKAVYVEYDDRWNKGRMNFDRIIRKEHKNDTVRIHPYKYINSSVLRDSYLKIGNSSDLFSKFMRVIISELDVLPSIYALFDFIDLQYRIVLAYIIGEDEKSRIKWIKNKGRVIGNIGVMANMIDKDIIQKKSEMLNEIISSDLLFGQIVTKENMNVIKRYLPNYDPDMNRPVEDSIVYLIISLRNALRGHGSFDKNDADELFEIVFKLALLNNIMICACDISLLISNESALDGGDGSYRVVYGVMKGIERKSLSPLVVADVNGGIMVYNNWDESDELGQIEYINYLDGTLILPKFQKM